MGDDYELGCPDCAAWDEAALTFCKGFPTKALEGRTLGEVLEALNTMVKYATWQFNEGGRHHPTLPSATAKAAALISHFKDPSRHRPRRTRQR